MFYFSPRRVSVLFLLIQGCHLAFFEKVLNLFWQNFFKIIQNLMKLQNPICISKQFFIENLAFIRPFISFVNLFCQIWPFFLWPDNPGLNGICTRLNHIIMLLITPPLEQVCRTQTTKPQKLLKGPQKCTKSSKGTHSSKKSVYNDSLTIFNVNSSGNWALYYKLRKTKEKTDDWQLKVIPIWGTQKKQRHVYYKSTILYDLLYDVS